MKKLLLFLLISAIFTAFLACGGEESVEEVGPEPTDIVDVVELPRIYVRNEIVYISYPKKYSYPKIPQYIDITNARARITYVTPSTFKREVLDSKYPVFIDFFAHWCGPCKTVAPYIRDLSKMYPEIKFVKYNVDQDDGSNRISPCDLYGVSGIPAFRSFYLGKEYTQFRFTGFSVMKYMVLVNNVDAFLRTVKKEIGASSNNSSYPPIIGPFCLR